MPRERVNWDSYTIKTAVGAKDGWPFNANRGACRRLATASPGRSIPLRAVPLLRWRSIPVIKNDENAPFDLLTLVTVDVAKHVTGPGKRILETTDTRCYDGYGQKKAVDFLLQFRAFPFEEHGEVCRARWHGAAWLFNAGQWKRGSDELSLPHASRVEWLPVPPMRAHARRTPRLGRLHVPTMRARARRGARRLHRSLPRHLPALRVALRVGPRLGGLRVPRVRQGTARLDCRPLPDVRGGLSSSKGIDDLQQRHRHEYGQRTFRHGLPAMWPDPPRSGPRRLAAGVGWRTACRRIT